MKPTTKPARKKKKEPRWICQRKNCKAVHWYKPDVCKHCGHTEVIESTT